MSLETRSSAHFKRAEQLRRWEDSETNREPTVPKVRSSRVKFPSSCVFLAACTAGDKDEVLKLLEKGIDINTPNVDGLTALHQACIEDNLDMVEFLVQNGANVNLGDNEGWTPLHATASCGFCSIAKYLIENGADVGAINNDGELAIDIAESDDMLDLLQDEIQKRGIDCEKARGDEQRRMLKDARDWASGECIESMDAPHHKTGATALHIAAAKGYIDVMHILLQNGLVDVDQQDYDGWTPLHAATHWNQREAAKLLVDNLADMEIKNFYRQTPFDVADPDMLKFLEELKVKQSSLNKEIILGKRQAKRKADAPAKIKKVELQIEKDKENDENLVGTVDNNVEKKNRVNAGSTDSSQRIYPPSSPATTPTSEQNNSTKQLPSPTQQAPPSVPPKAIENNTEDIGTIPSWRRPASLRSRLGNDSPTKSLSLRIGEKEQKSPTSPTGKNISDNSDVVLRRTHSFENDEKKDQLTNTTTTSSSASSPQQNTPSTPPTATVNTANTSPNRTSQSSPTATSPQPNSQVRRSFVPPVRDEESETQRKAHAKRVRETRRSTQGVTLDEIKSAEQLVKQKNQPKNATDQDVTTTVVVTSTSNGDTTSTNGNNTPSVTATITTGAPTVVVPVTRANEDTSSSDQQNIQNNSLHERRPSWRLRVDNGSKFKLEDATATNNATTAGGTPTVFIRRAATTTPSSGQVTTRPSSAPVETSVPPSPPADTVVTLPLRRNSKPIEDKEQDKENDVRNAQATQAVIQRRRRPKRRSTGVVHVDMDEIDPDKQDSNVGGDSDDIKLNHQDSGSEQQGNNKESRLSASRGELIVTRNENGEVDYKKLWEQAQADNDRLRDKLRKQDEELRDTKLTLEKISTVTSKNSLSELEKRERRAMERKLSEMEEELKQLEALKVENQKLKDENGALIRVISKLSK